MTGAILGPYVHDKIEDIRSDDGAGQDTLFLLAIVDDVFALLEYAHVDDLRSLLEQTNCHWTLDVRDWLNELEALRIKFNLRELEI
jgi:hypothetical protein